MWLISLCHHLANQMTFLELSCFFSVPVYYNVTGSIRQGKSYNDYDTICGIYFKSNETRVLLRLSKQMLPA